MVVEMKNEQYKIKNEVLKTGLLEENKPSIINSQSSILEKYNIPGPRYTSYPPATFFHTGFTDDDYIKNIVKSNNSGPKNISLYIHIPFCYRLCHFCGCNTAIKGKPEFIQRYINALLKEIETVAKHISKKRQVTQIHWGGGTPNAIPLDLVGKVMSIIFSIFKVSENAEIAMECNPAYLELDDIDKVATYGFNRLSLGIQDFNTRVLKNVNREPSLHPVDILASHIRNLGFEGVNLDLIYGLPGQTVDSFIETVKKAIEISPDRIVTFSYAHIPRVKSAQKHLEKAGLPTPKDKLDMFGAAYKLLLKSGYISIGMDHYAKPGDMLSKALDKKMLHRNFQGYCTKETTGQVYGLGASSISQLEYAYAQNKKDTKAYIEKIEKYGTAVDKGYELSFTDSVRRTVINEIMCNGYLDLCYVANKYNTTVESIEKITGYSPAKLKEYIDDGLLKTEGKTVILEPAGFFVVRNIAMQFDPLSDIGKNQYSKTV